MASPSHKRKRHRSTAQTHTTTDQKHPKHKKLVEEEEEKDPSFSLQPPNFLSDLLRRLGSGIAGAVYACAVLTTLATVSAVLGFGAVTMWAEEPVFVRERVYFDYAEARPMAVMRLLGDVKNQGIVPVGHSFNVRLVLFLPESDYNRDIGVFQVVADLISTDENVIARTSQPCMLKFRSLPIRLTRTFLMGLPLLIGLASETQKMIIPILYHKEKGYPRTKAIKVTLIPRPGTTFLPQIYESEIILNSKLPWKKDIVRRWKWTFCIWTSLYIYVLLVLVLVCCFRHVIFPREVEVERDEESVKVEKEGENGKDIEEREVSEMLRRWRRRRTKRKAMMMFDNGVLSGKMGPFSASSMSVKWEETHSDSEF